MVRLTGSWARFTGGSTLYMIVSCGENGVIPLFLPSFLSFFLSFFCQRGRRVAGGELRHLAGSPGGGGGY